MRTITITVLSAIAILAIVSICGITGVLFIVWPTSIADKGLKVDEEAIHKLVELKNQKKFVADKDMFYPGAPNEAVRLEAESEINKVVDHLIRNVPQNPQKSFILKTFKIFLPNFERYDSEERDQVLTYLEQIMKIFDIEDSGELLNVWRYGFPYGLFWKET